MFYCKSCGDDFNMIENIPYILKCTHTFCQICLQQSLMKLNKFDCINCFYSCENINDTMINTIICDRSSYRAMNLKQKNRSFRNTKSNFRNSSRNYSKSIKQKIQSTKSKQKIKMEIEFNESFGNFDKSLSFANNEQKEENFSSNLIKPCKSHFCNKVAYEDYCSNSCREMSFRTNKRNQKGFLTPQKFSTNNHEFGITTPLRERGFLTKSKFNSRATLTRKDFFNNQSKGRVSKCILDSKLSGRALCKNPDCNNLRNMNRKEFGYEFCGMKCEGMFEENYED